MTTLSVARKTLLSAALLAAATAAQAVSYNISNSQAGWLSSVQAIGPTTFGTGTFTGVGCAPGVACADVAVNGLPGVSFAQVGPGSASYDGGLLNNLGVGGVLEWSFATPQNGWGGTFRMTTGNGVAFQALDLILGWVDVTSVSSTQELNGFLGFSSTDRFSGVRVSNSDNPTSSYRMSDVSIARATVPEPGSLALLALAGSALAVARRRRRA